jgi:GT2 family glycosyltransferase
MNGHTPTVSAVILSYDRPDYLREALSSLLAQTCRPTEIIVVDNNSPKSAEVAQVVEQYRGVKLIQNDVNVGYAAGMNRGIAEATGLYTYLTEDDIVLEKDCIRQLVDYMEEHPATGITSPVMYNKAAGTIRCAGGEVVLGGVYLRRTYDEHDRETKNLSQPFDVSYIDGATMLARTYFLQSTGGFREEFFMYVEAVEFCIRVAKARKKLTVVPAAKVYHFEPLPAANHSPEFDFHRYKNLFSLYLLHAPARCLPEFFARYVVLTGFRAAFGRGGNMPMLLKALLWTLKRMPSLLRERRSDRRPAREIVNLLPQSHEQNLSSR